MSETGLDDLAKPLIEAVEGAEALDPVGERVGRIVREPGMTAKLQDLGFVVEGRPPAPTGEFLRSEVERWGSVIRTANVTVE